MAWVASVVSLISTLYLVLPAHGAGTTVCYTCSSEAGLACGLSRGWTVSYLENTAQLCPEGMCYTYLKTSLNRSPTVSRGCGQLSCDSLPAGNYTTDLCEKDAAGVYKVKKVTNGLFNQSRQFSSENRDFNTATLQYCDSDRCNNGSIQFVQPEMINTAPPTSCINCRGLVSETCGLKSTGGGSVQSVACSAGYCFTYVRAEAGSMPQVMRGCGGVPCNLIPGASGASSSCDENGKLAPVDTANGGLFNQSRSFYIPFAPPNQVLQTGTVQYCNNGPNCNSGPIAGFSLKNYYYLVQDGGASGLTVSLAGIVVALLGLWIL